MKIRFKAFLSIYYAMCGLNKKAILLLKKYVDIDVALIKKERSVMM